MITVFPCILQPLHNSRNAADVSEEDKYTLFLNHTGLKPSSSFSKDWTVLKLFHK